MCRSPAVAHAFFRPIAEREYRKFSEWKKAIAQYEFDLTDYNRSKRDERGPAPKKPRRVQFYVDDTTLEALGDALQDNPRGVMWRVDELSGLVASFDRYHSGGGKEGGTRARLLSAFDCQEWKSGRRDVTRNVYIPAACVSIFGGLQPAMLARSFDGSDADVGFLPRFIFICAEREKPALWSEASLSAADEILLRQIVEALASFELVENETVPAVFPLSPEAKGFFVDWYNQQALESWEMLSEGVADSLGQKLKGHALRLCLLLHCLDIALGGVPDMSAVSGATMRRALALAEWVKANQLRVLSIMNAGAKQYTPIEHAVMVAVVAEAELLGRDDFTLTNARLVDVVNASLPVKVRPEKIGKAAAGLGMTTCLVGEKRLRGKTVTPSVLNLFKATVSTVSMPCTPRVSKVRQYEYEPSQPSRNEADGRQNG